MRAMADSDGQPRVAQRSAFAAGPSAEREGPVGCTRWLGGTDLDSTQIATLLPIQHTEALGVRDDRDLAPLSKPLTQRDLHNLLRYEFKRLK